MRRQDGLLKAYKFDAVRATELETAKEVLVLGGGSVMSVVSVNGTNIGANDDPASNGSSEGRAEPGPVFQVLRRMLAAGAPCLFLCRTHRGFSSHLSRNPS